MNYLLIEDDCAPDARKEFEQELITKYGVSINDFKEKGKRLPTVEDTLCWSYKGYLLHYYADAPYYHFSIDLDLSKEEAIELMKEGIKITHTYFTPEEWVTIDNGNYLFEDGARCDEKQYWNWGRETSDFWYGWRRWVKSE